MLPILLPKRGDTRNRVKTEKCENSIRSLLRIIVTWGCCQETGLFWLNSGHSLITWKTTRYPLVIINAVFPSLIFKNERKWATKWCSLWLLPKHQTIDSQFLWVFFLLDQGFLPLLTYERDSSGTQSSLGMLCDDEATQCGLVCYTHPLWELPIMLWCLVQLAISFERYCLGRFSLIQCHSEEALFFLFYRKSRAE